MLRRNLVFWCAATAKTGAADATTATKTEIDPAATPQGEKVAEKVVEKKKVVEVSKWKKLPLHSWQTNLPTTSQQTNFTSPDVFFHGKTLGPFPLMVLGNAGAGSVGVDQHATWLSHLGTNHGALSVPLQTVEEFKSGIKTTENAEFPPTHDECYIDQHCHKVARAMDIFGLSWTHFITHSVGALVAAKMCWLYPEKVGTVVLLDTPLLNKHQARNKQLREELLKAQLDVNTPQSLLYPVMDELEESFSSGREVISSCGMSQESQKVYDQLVFPKDKVFANNGAVRDEAPYFLSTEHIDLIRHPVMLVSPSGATAAAKDGGGKKEKGGKKDDGAADKGKAANTVVADAAIHKANLNLRKHQVVATAPSHEQLFADSSAVGEEVAAAVSSWTERFDMDAAMKKKYGYALKDLRSRMTPGAGAGGAGGGDAKGKGKEQFPPGKKNKQKKGKK